MEDVRKLRSIDTGREVIFHAGSQGWSGEGRRIIMVDEFIQG